jgi:hypothetical protein
MNLQHPREAIFPKGTSVTEGTIKKNVHALTKPLISPVTVRVQPWPKPTIGYEAYFRATEHSLPTNVARFKICTFRTDNKPNIGHSCACGAQTKHDK